MKVIAAISAIALSFAAATARAECEGQIYTCGLCTMPVCREDPPCTCFCKPDLVNCPPVAAVTAQAQPSLDDLRAAIFAAK